MCLAGYNRSAKPRLGTASLKVIDMDRFWLPLALIIVGAIGILLHDDIKSQWAAMYPDHAARQSALANCTTEDSWFNRFSAKARAACYQKYLVVSEARP
jgi:hypothetical protein